MLFIDYKGSQRGHRTSPRTLLTPSTHCSHCYHLADDIEAWKPEHPDLKTVFIHRPSGCWMTRSHDNSVYLHYNHYLHYTQYCEQYLHCSNVYILYISHVFQCLSWMRTLHMQTCLSSSYKFIVYILYFIFLCFYMLCVGKLCKLWISLPGVNYVHTTIKHLESWIFGSWPKE